MAKKTAVIIGAGPAGLTAALEFLRGTDIKPIVFESGHQVGGISKTINHNGNRMDLGGHRFFSKSDWVMDWWQSILPIRKEETENEEVAISYRNKTRTVAAAGADNGDCMLIRPRTSRIYFLRRFFDYPIKMNWTTAKNLGIVRIVRILASYIWIRFFPRRPETNLEDFIINRFGRELYLTFFKDYTEKVWGVPCEEISAEWGAQRIKGLSISAAIGHALGAIIRKLGGGNFLQKNTNTSLIERFLYPRLGPGQMWETVARKVEKDGGEIHFGQKATRIFHENGSITAVEFISANGTVQRVAADYVISTMPVRDLVLGLNPPAPPAIYEVAAGLMYRSFITAGVAVKKLKPSRYSQPNSPINMLPDNWIYIQEKEVRLGRLQIFNNWSPDMVANPDTVWLGLEYFCDEDDDLWRMSEAEFSAFAIKELASIDLIDPADVLDTTVVKVEKAYPAYFGSYNKFGLVRDYLDDFANLYPIGRNGMHRYNNQDHSMLTAKLAVEAIAAGLADKQAIWEVNIGDDYHEEKPGATEKGTKLTETVTS
ncbi:MAG: NAD(P)/FAD-dependent oxidoreductase [Pseudomonadota bacterium]